LALNSPYYFVLELLHLHLKTLLKYRAINDCMTSKRSKLISSYKIVVDHTVDCSEDHQKQEKTGNAIDGALQGWFDEGNSGPPRVDQGISGVLPVNRNRC
jgi:hypothetical protein